MSEEQNDALKDVIKDLYNDLGHPSAACAGETLTLVPRAVKAALAPLEQWILQREYNVAETKKLLEEKLKNISPEDIEPPEPHIAVPAMQYISYCMDNVQLRNMYANLLANSMTKAVKNGVHPGFVEIIKQLSPDEARVMRYMQAHMMIPILIVSYETESSGRVRAVSDFSDIGYQEDCACDRPQDIQLYFDNLVRLGLLEKVTTAQFTDQRVYEALKQRLYDLSIIDDQAAHRPPYKGYVFEHGYIRISSYGSAFCGICLDGPDAQRSGTFPL